MVPYLDLLNTIGLIIVGLITLKNSLQVNKIKISINGKLQKIIGEAAKDKETKP